MSAADSLKSTGNRVLDELLHIMISRFEHLVERGFLAPHFLAKMINDPTEILKFLRQNRAVVGDQLNRRLDPSIRPSPSQLEKKGIVPQGYFSHGYDIAMKKKHRRRSTAGQDLAMMIQLRPKPEEIIQKGIVIATNNENENQNINNEMDPMNYDYDDIKELQQQEEDMEIYNISICNSLLFKTIAEALSKSCIDTTAEETAVLCEMQEMNREMKVLRDTLDKYFLSSNPDILAFQQEEDMVRDKFHGIQSKLLHISQRQNRIHEKLKILHTVEQSMVELQNLYDKQLNELKMQEEKLLLDLCSQRLRRDKAIKIMLCERSHQDWAQAKLTYTIEIARNHELQDEFVDELQQFLDSLNKISIHQQQIVADYEQCISELEQSLVKIRHEMGKVRTMTFKKIYDLHKQVQIADTIELGLINRRLSVATATELERERNHNNTKIHRQLNTLSNYILKKKKNNQKTNLNNLNQNLQEIVDIQLIMSDAKLKSFFCVFIQIFNQTICDIELMYRNLNSKSIKNGITTKQHLDKITKLCQSLYGINNVMNKINCNENSNLNDKLKKCMRFITILKQSIANQYHVKIVSTHRLNIIIIYIARKLCVNEHMVDEIEKTHDQQIPRLAEIRSKDIFQAILQNQKIFHLSSMKKNEKNLKNIKTAANKILENVFGI